MISLKKVLVPIDFSSSAQNAIQYCLGLMLDNNLEVTLLNVYPEQSNASINDLQKQLDHWQFQFESVNLACKTMLRAGSFEQVVVEVQQEIGADLILMGTNGALNQQESHSASVVQSADCPILVVPENVNGFKIKNIALTLDHLKIDDNNALSVLFDLARAHQAKIHVLTINNKGWTLDKLSTPENDQILDYYFQQLEYHHAFPENTDVEQGILGYVQEHNIDLLAIMPRHHARNSAPSEGQLTKLLALHSEVPLLTLD